MRRTAVPVPVCGLAAALLGLSAGCVGVVAGPAPTDTPQQRDAGSTASSAQLAEYAVRTAYEEFWWVLDRIDAQPPARQRGVLSVVAADPELTRQLAQAHDRSARGVHLYGHVTTHIIAVRSAGTSPATLIDCLDASQSGQAANSTNQALNTGPASIRIVATLTREREFGPWKVTDLQTNPDLCAHPRPTPTSDTAARLTAPLLHSRSDPAPAAQRLSSSRRTRRFGRPATPPRPRPRGTGHATPP
jgi:hypothetical protein